MNPESELWKQSEMHDLDCRKCHEIGIIESLGHIIKVEFAPSKNASKITNVDSKLCEKCHASYDYQWKQVRNTDGHKLHYYQLNQDKINCVDCHRSNLHVFKPPENVCIECHREETFMNTPEVSIHCLDCHEFSERELFPEPDDCVNCHDFARSQFVMGGSLDKIQDKTDCNCCHDPCRKYNHGDCVECHPNSENSSFAYTGHQTCVICHSSHLSTGLRETCLSCHIESETHYIQVQCNLCHAFHSKEKSMNTSEISIHCMDCHDFSDPALYSDSDDCETCHIFDESHSVMDESLHNEKDGTDCMSCHIPHTEDKYEECIDCHQVSTGGLHENPGHQMCALCHSPHQSLDLRENCISCHMDRESHNTETRCIMCHSFT